MILLNEDCLRFSFEDVHQDATCEIEFQRTLRIPDDGNHYPLPPGLGRFLLRHLDDYSGRLPADLASSRRCDCSRVSSRGFVDQLFH